MEQTKPTAASNAAPSAVTGILLAAAMAATRVHGAGLGAVLPDASLAVFFLTGLTLGSPLWFGVLLVEAVALDAVAIGFAHVPAVCVTWGYAALLPAYGALWLAGRRAMPAAGSRPAVVSIGIALAAGVAAYFAISNLGYYAGGGFAARDGVLAYVGAVLPWLPLYMAAAGFYSALGLAGRAVAARWLRRPLARA